MYKKEYVLEKLAGIIAVKFKEYLDSIANNKNKKVKK